VYIRFTAALLALAAGAIGIVVVVSLLRSTPGPTSTSASAPSAAPAAQQVVGGRIATSDPAFPAPPRAAVVLAREAGRDALAIAVKPGLVRVSVLAPSGEGAVGRDVSVRAGSGAYRATEPCGPGCYQLGMQGAPRSPVSVRLDGTAYRFDVPGLPAPDGSAIVSRAEDTWNALRTLVWHERLGGSPTDVVHVLYRAVAPDQLAYTIDDGSAAVVLGGRRWDRSAPGAPWRQSIQNPPLRQPQPFWRNAADVHVIGSAQLGSHAVWRVSFFDPATPAWFEAWIDKATSRTLQLGMTAASHFMHDTYGPFDSNLRLRPPT
jgi:hypothetical protein